MTEIASVSASNEIEEICYRRKFDNHAKEALNKIHEIFLSTKPMYGELGLIRPYEIFHRIFLGSCNMCALLI